MGCFISACGPLELSNNRTPQSTKVAGMNIDRQTTSRSVSFDPLQWGTKSREVPRIRPVYAPCLVCPPGFPLKNGAPGSRTRGRVQSLHEGKLALKLETMQGRLLPYGQGQQQLYLHS